MTEALAAIEALSSISHLIGLTIKLKRRLCPNLAECQSLVDHAPLILALGRGARQLSTTDIPHDTSRSLKNLAQKCDAFARIARDLQDLSKPGQAWYRRLSKMREFNSLISELKGTWEYLDTPLRVFPSYGLSQSLLSAQVHPTTALSITDRHDPSVAETMLRNDASESSFVGRHRLLRLLEEKLNAPEMNSKVALAGVPGIGKSRVADECVKRIRMKHAETVVHWIDGNSTLSAMESLRGVIKTVKAESNIDPDSMLGIPKQTPCTVGNTLLVFDGWNNPEILSQTHEYLNFFAQCRVIFTTQDKRTVREFVPKEDVFQLGGLSSDEAETLFYRHAPNKSFDPIELGNLLDLLKDVDYTPSAIEHAAWHISKNDVSPSSYAELLWGKRGIPRTLDINRTLTVDDCPSMSSSQVFETLYSNIRQDALARDIIILTAILGRQNIRANLIASILGQPKRRIIEALEVLQAFCMIDCNHDDQQYHSFGTQHSTTLHLLARLATIDPTGMMRRAVAEALLPSLAYDSEAQVVLHSTLSCVPYAQSLLQVAKADIGTVDRDTVTASFGILASRLRDIFKIQGSYVNSIIYANLATDIFTASMGRSIHTMNETFARLAESKELSGDIRGAERLWRRVLDMRKRENGVDDTTTIAAMRDLGINLHEQGRFLAARKQYYHALKLLKCLGGPVDERMKTLHSLAVTLQSLGRYDNAEKMHRKVLRWRARHLEPDHHLTLSTVNNLGTLYHLQENWDSALDMYQRALAGKTKRLGIAHPLTLRVQMNMAMVHEAKGDIRKAGVILQQSLNLYRNKLGTDDHIDIIAALKLHARVLYGQEKYVESERVTAKAFTASCKVFGEKHEETLELWRDADALASWLEANPEYPGYERRICRDPPST